MGGQNDLGGPLDRAFFEHIVTIERPGDRPITNIVVDGRLWASVMDDVLLRRLRGDQKLVEKWAENVVKNLLKCLRDDVDIWAEALWNTKHDFLMRCAP